MQDVMIADLAPRKNLGFFLFNLPFVVFDGVSSLRRHLAKDQKFRQRDGKAHLAVTVFETIRWMGPKLESNCTRCQSSNSLTRSVVVKFVMEILAK